MDLFISIIWMDPALYHKHQTHRHYVACGLDHEGLGLAHEQHLLRIAIQDMDIHHEHLYPEHPALPLDNEGLYLNL